MPNIPHLLLAAGGSTRMGQPKYLLPWGNKTLLEARVETLLETKQPVFVVVGPNAQAIQKLVNPYSIEILKNSLWSDGMGTSLVVGIKGIIQALPDATAVLVSLLDQPLIPTSHYTAMYKQFEKDTEKIVVSESNEGWQGAPVLFPASYFKELLQLTPTQSGKTLIQKYPSCVQSVPGNDFLMDMDTPEAYLDLLKKKDS